MLCRLFLPAAFPEALGQALSHQAFAEESFVGFPAELPDAFVQYNRRDEEQTIGNKHGRPIWDQPAQTDEQPTQRMRQLARRPTTESRIGFLCSPGDPHDDAQHERHANLDDSLSTIIKNEIHKDQIVLY